VTEAHWAGEWRRRLGRPLRVLHVGNVANNAYLNARMLNDAGLDCDVLCPGNYHIMASPEWEELDDLRVIVDPDRPDWDAAAPRAVRPRWFSQGPAHAAAAYLAAKRGGSRWRAATRWRALELRRRLSSGQRWRWARRAHAASRGWRASPVRDGTSPGPSDLTLDIVSYGRHHGWTSQQLRDVFTCYDVIHGYGAEAILPYAAGARPYIAWEHGTLRQLPFERSTEGRLTAEAYRAADQVVITNADNRSAAERLGIARYRFMPHPINESRPSPESVTALREQLRRRLDADFLLFHPSRQHWHPERPDHLEKGNDRLIAALAQFFEVRPGAGAIFVEWGDSVEESRALIGRLGLDRRIAWIPPQTGLSMARHMLACDVMADQFHLGAFGSTLPRALFLGCPSMIHLDAAVHRWCLPELPPVMNVREPAEMVAALQRAAADRAWLAGLAERGRRWYESYHSNAVVLSQLGALYADAVAVTPPGFDGRQPPPGHVSGA